MKMWHILIPVPQLHRLSIKIAAASNGCLGSNKPHPGHFRMPLPIHNTLQLPLQSPSKSRLFSPPATSHNDPNVHLILPSGDATLCLNSSSKQAPHSNERAEAELIPSVFRVLCILPVPSPSLLSTSISLLTVEFSSNYRIHLVSRTSQEFSCLRILTVQPAWVPFPLCPASSPFFACLRSPQCSFSVGSEGTPLSHWPLPQLTRRLFSAFDIMWNLLLFFAFLTRL